MTALRAPMPESLRRRLAVAAAIAVATLSAPAAKAAGVKADNEAKAAAQAAAQAASAPKTSFWDDLSNFALTWGPLIFMGLICVLIGMTMRFMPRTKPQEIKPDTSQ